jgi:hypothetical protein
VSRYNWRWQRRAEGFRLRRPAELHAGRTQTCKARSHGVILVDQVNTHESSKTKRQHNQSKIDHVLPPNLPGLSAGVEASLLSPSCCPGLLSAEAVNRSCPAFLAAAATYSSVGGTHCVSAHHRRRDHPARAAPTVESSPPPAGANGYLLRSPSRCRAHYAAVQFPLLQQVSSSSMTARQSRNIPIFAAANSCT